MKLYGFVILSLIFIFSILSFSTNASALDWHDCCNVIVDNAKLESLYFDFVENNFCVEGYSHDECVANANKAGRSFDNFKQVLIDDPKHICLEKTKDLKDEFTNGYDSLFGPVSFKALDEFYYYAGPNVDFSDPFLDGMRIDPVAYDVEKTLWKEPRDIGNMYYNFQVSNSRFNYLKPTSISASKMSEIYTDQYYSTKEICDNIDLPFDTAEENSALYNSCKLKNNHFSKAELDAYYFYSDLKGFFYTKALGVCEEEFGFQNDIGLIRFPGQPGQVSCSQGDLVDGCCPGYHMDSKFNVCCSTGFEAYQLESGSVLCGPAQMDDEIVSVNIILEDDELLLDGKDTIKATLKYEARTPLGEIVPYANKNIYHGIVAESKTSQFSFKVEKLSSKTDENGNLDVVISLKDANLDLLGLDKNEPTTVFVYSLDQPDNERDDASFILSYGDGIKIDSIKKASDGPVWQGAGAELVVKVSDPINELKRYTFTSKSGLRVNGANQEVLNDGATAYLTTKDNEVHFGWFAPKLSQEMKMDYSRRIQESLIKMTLVVAEDVAGAKLSKFQDLNKLEDLDENFQKLNKLYDGMNKLVKTKIQSDGAIERGQAMAKTAKEPYQVAKEGIAYIMWIEGTIGLLGKPASPLLTTLKVGLTGVNDWYSLVEDLEKVAKAEKIDMEFPVTVKVEGLSSGSNDTLEQDIPVQGFEMVLG